MAFKYADRVKETTSNKPVGGGTPGAFNLGGAKTGFQTFVAGVATTNTCVACAQQVDANGNPSGAWEIFTGTVTAAAPDTLSRDTLISSATGAFLRLRHSLKNRLRAIPRNHAQRCRSF